MGRNDPMFSAAPLAETERALAGSEVRFELSAVGAYLVARSINALGQECETA